MNTLLQLVGLAPEHRDVITTGGQIVLAAIGLLIAVVGYFTERLRREVKKTRRGQQEIGENARLAAERSKPTGNGFAARTEAKLDWLIQSHTDLSSDVRGLRVEVDHQGRRLDRHLDERKQP